MSRVQKARKLADHLLDEFTAAKASGSVPVWLVALLREASRILRSTKEGKP